MNDFEFYKPASLADAVKALGQSDNAKVLAGGQSLIPIMKLNLAAPDKLIALSSLAELKGIRRDGGRLVIGAATTHAEVSAAAEVQSAIPALAELAGHIGDPQVRHRGTLGGSLAHNDPAADYPAAVLALDAQIQTDRRTIAADDFFRGMFETALEPNEIIKAVSFAVPERAKYAKFPNPASRFAVVGVMVARFGKSVRVTVVGAGQGVFRARDLETALEAKFSAEALDRVTVAADDLASDLHASAEYRAHLIGVMARRAVLACV